MPCASGIAEFTELRRIIKRMASLRKNLFSNHPCLKREHTIQLFTEFTHIKELIQGEQIMVTYCDDVVRSDEDFTLVISCWDLAALKDGEPPIGTIEYVNPEPEILLESLIDSTFSRCAEDNVYILSFAIPSNPTYVDANHRHLRA
jgi:hypothetical protein